MNSLETGSIIYGVLETPKCYRFSSVCTALRPGLVLGKLQKWLRKPSVKTQTWRVLLSDLLTPCPVYSEHVQFAILPLLTGQWLHLLDALNRKIFTAEHKSISPA